MYVDSRYEEFVTCLEALLPTCPLGKQLLYQGLRDAYNFICNDGFDGQCSSVQSHLVTSLSTVNDLSEV